MAGRCLRVGVAERGECSGQQRESARGVATAVAIAWAVDRPGISSVITGPRTLDQLEDNLVGLALALPPDISRHLDAVSAAASTPVTGMPVTSPGTPSG